MEWMPYVLSIAGALILLLVAALAFFLKDIYRDTKSTFGIVSILQQEWVTAKEDLKRSRELYTEVQILKVDFERLRKHGNGNARYTRDS